MADDHDEEHAMAVFSDNAASQRAFVDDEDDAVGLNTTPSVYATSSTMDASYAGDKSRDNLIPSEKDKKSKAVARGESTYSARPGATFDDRPDYVLVFKKNSNEKPQHVALREKFLAACREKGLYMENDEDQDDCIFVKISASFERLKIAAQQNNLRLPLKKNIRDTNVPVTADRNCAKILHRGFAVGVTLDDDDGYFWAAFQVKNEHKFLNHDDERKFFSYSQRSLLVFYILNHIKYGDSVAEVGINKLLQSGAFWCIYPPHDGPADTSYGATLYDNDRLTLAKTWARWGALWAPQPFELIREYFGEKVAFYFVWLGFYTRWLIPASIIGLLVFIYGFGSYKDYDPAAQVCASNLTICAPCDSCQTFLLNSTCENFKASAIFDNALTIPFACFMSIWAVFFVEFWKRQQSLVAFKWDTRGIEEEEVPRPQFIASDRRKSPITGEMEDYYPFKKRVSKIAVSMSVVIFMLFVVIAAVFAVILYRLAVRVAIYNTDPNGAAGSQSALITSVTAAILNLICILILNQIYQRIARVLNSWENHRTETEYEDHLIFKTYLFQFVNSYASIFYIAFFKGKFIGTPLNWDNIGGVRLDFCPAYGCMMDLAIQLAIIMVGKQLIGNLVEIIIPAIKKRCHQRDLGTDNASAKQYERDLSLNDFSGLFPEYLEMILQLGYVTLFVCAFPLAPAFALLNNIFEIRIDAKKFVFQEKRGPSIRAEDIGTWEAVVTALSAIAVVTNAFVIGFTANILDRVVYKSEYGSMNGYVDMMFPPSPITSCVGQPNNHNCECNYLGYRDANGVLTAFHWETLAVRLAFIIFFEHVVFFLQILLAFLIPDVPGVVREAIERENYMGRLALGDFYDSDEEDKK